MWDLRPMQTITRRLKQWAVGNQNALTLTATVGTVGEHTQQQAGARMNIKVTAKHGDGLFEGVEEVWVRVRMSTIVDWPTVEKALSDEDRSTLNALGSRQLHYYPHHMTDEERAESGHRFEEWYVWTHKKGA